MLLFFYNIVLSDNIFSCFIENDNRRIITALKKLIKIYSKYLRKKILYYFYKYRSIVTIISVNEIINDLDTNSSIPFSLSDIDPLESYNILKHFPNTNIYNNNNHIPKLNSSLAYSFISENNQNFENNTERINNRIYLDKKSMKKRRNLSYGNLQIKLKNDNENYKDYDISKYNKNNIFNNSYVINNNKHSLKHAFPPYIYTTPNKYIYPIILNNNNNNTMNNSLLYQFPSSTVVYQTDEKNEQSKPLLWYTNVYPSISQVSIMQDNRYLNSFQNETPKYINNSAYFNSITNINNSYSEDYLNKQIFDFINANSKTKKSIITNIGKKHNVKLSRSKKLSENNIKSKEKLEKNKKDKNIGKNRNNQMILEKINNKSNSEFHDINNECFQNNNNKFKKNPKIKINKNNKSDKLINQIPIGQKKRIIINNLKGKNIYLDRNKIIKNYSIEISNSRQLINNTDFICEKDSNSNQSINFCTTNQSQFTKENQNSYKKNNNIFNTNENIYNVDNSKDKEKSEINNNYNESLRTSLQSINDSKMLEMANYFVEEEKIVNKEQIKEILNEKTSQRNIKLNK